MAMDRRQWLGTLGGLGLTLPAAVGAVEGAQDHPKPGEPTPMTGPFAHFCGIHMAKNNPKLQFVTHHYCAGHAENHGGPPTEHDMFQCVLFDSTGPNARLIGVEYLISDAAYRKLPDDEKKFWHAHTYEVLGGGLIAPSMSPEDEKAFMKKILPTWGKAWHTWPDPATKVPMGEPLLIWSLMGDGQADDKLVEARDREFGCSTKAIREARIKEFGLEVPRVPLPESMNTIGRQWTASGDDKPTRTP
jgi:hypothetical protein